MANPLRPKAAALLLLATALGFACTPPDRGFPLATSGAGGAGGAGGSGQGGAEGCSLPADCPEVENAKATCSLGVCGSQCLDKYLDCDAAKPGCEAHWLASDSCGACGTKCLTSCAEIDGKPACNDPVDVSVGLAHACLLRRDGSVYCWGDNSFGQLGTKGPLTKSQPELVPLPDRAVKVVAGGGYGAQSSAAHTCAILVGGALYCWGSGESGQLGTGDLASRPEPMPVGAAGIVKQVALGAAHTCALNESNEVLCWGADTNGQVGDAGLPAPAIPNPALAVKNAKQVAAGDRHTCAVDNAGFLFCWGLNQDGQLGNGDTMSRQFPVKATGPLASAVDEVALGDRHSCARKGQELFCFGNNYNGAVGSQQAPIGPVPVPQKVDVPPVKGFDLGLERTGVLVGDGSVMMWGVQFLGDQGAAPLSPVPLEIGQSGAARLSLGHTSSCVLKPPGEIFCWGEDGAGQLGNGEPDGTPSPTATPVVLPP
jgi:alpha-tubulin suppressor-like RCC1 family protein